MFEIQMSQKDWMMLWIGLGREVWWKYVKGLMTCKAKKINIFYGEHL